MVVAANSSTKQAQLKELLLDKQYITVPKEGETVKGIVISISPREILLDIQGYKTGIIRGLELQDKERIYPDLKMGDTIEATVLELENEEGQVELSLRFVGAMRAAEVAIDAKTTGSIVEAKIVDANRGGLMATWSGMTGFIPVSQLSPEHYPRVPGGDKAKILERLRAFVGETLRVQVLDCDPREDKLIFSEKGVWEEEQKDLLTKYKVGDVVEGAITAVADFGVFVRFSAEGGSPPKADAPQEHASGGEGLEGLVHISEIAWQRIDNPADLVKVGDIVRAQVLNIQGSKIFLSMRALIDDPWKKVHERYSIDQSVQGKILKINPFGLFVELDPEIHGLAHVSELMIKPEIPLEEQVHIGEVRTFKVVSIEPEHHRLGLSEKKLSEPEVLEAPNATSAPEAPEASPSQEDVVQ